MDIDILGEAYNIINDSDNDDNNSHTETESDGSEEIEETAVEEINISLDDLFYDQNNYGCKHYLRRCLIYAECCKKYVNCRLCHDEEQEELMMNLSSKIEDDHKLDRYITSKIKCTKCETEQTVKQNCEKCNICFGFYFCNICNLFDDIDKDYYHCNKCKICRVGRGLKYIHCDKCNMCYVEDFKHKCIEISDCPICYDDLHGSTTPIVKLKCGHTMHGQCITELIKSTYKCPVCKKSMADMSEQYKHLDKLIEE